MLNIFHRTILLLLISFSALAQAAQGQRLVAGHQQHSVQLHAAVADIAEMPDEHVQEEPSISREVYHRA